MKSKVVNVQANSSHGFAAMDHFQRLFIRARCCETTFGKTFSAASGSSAHPPSMTEVEFEG